VSILEDLNNPPRRAIPFPEWLIRQTPEIRKALEAAAGDYRWSDRALELLLRKHGAQVSKDSVKAWRDSVLAG
jgi:hypothetical protein